MKLCEPTSDTISDSCSLPIHSHLCITLPFFLLSFFLYFFSMRVSFSLTLFSALLFRLNLSLIFLSPNCFFTYFHWPDTLFTSLSTLYPRYLEILGGHDQVNWQSKSAIYPHLLSNIWVIPIEDDGVGWTVWKEGDVSGQGAGGHPYLYLSPPDVFSLVYLLNMWNEVPSRYPKIRLALYLQRRIEEFKSSIIFFSLTPSSVKL